MPMNAHTCLPRDANFGIEAALFRFDYGTETLFEVVSTHSNGDAAHASLHERILVHRCVYCLPGIHVFD